MSKKTYHVRKFLNKNKGTAAIEIDSGVTHYSLDGSVEITDCNRKISLDMGGMGRIYRKGGIAQENYTAPLPFGPLTTTQGAKSREYSRSRSTGRCSQSFQLEL